MQRRDVLRRTVVLGVAASTIGLAGCADESGDDGSDGNDGGDGSGGNNGGGGGGGGDSTPAGPTGEVVENSVSGLEIVDWTTSATDEDLVDVLTLENVGDQQTAGSNYTYEIAAYNGAGEDITAGFATDTSGSTVAPGETTTVDFFLGAFGGPSAIARFEVTLRCRDGIDSGVYCGG